MQITPHDWETVKLLFEAALERPREERTVFLNENCPNSDLRREIEVLLSDYEKAGSFLDVSQTAANSSPTMSFAPGEVLAGRFRVVRFIAAGGMGQVYEAEDLELREHVAIKTIIPEFLAQPGAVARFKREVHLARKVTHPNACRIFDLFRHKTPTGEEVIFVSMELLQEKTLGERIKEAGRLEVSEALSIVEQMASALDAAHAAGVVHRDLKPGNIILASSGTGVRAVITDFGLALDSVGQLDGPALVSTHGMLGTPAYMSPEQLQGKTATSASDIYALGLVIYEMVAGARPFAGDSPLVSAMKRLEQAPVSPRKHVPELDRKWEAAILRCLETDPGERFIKAGDVVKALSSDTSLMPRRRTRHQLALPGIIIAAFLVGVITVALHERSMRRGSPVAPSSSNMRNSRRSVAVLGFKNVSGHPDATWLSSALSEMLTTELGAGEQLRTIPGENVARTKLDLSLPDTDGFAKDTLVHIHKNLNTDYVVLGSYFDSGEESGHQVRLDLRLQDAVAGETVASISEMGSEAQLLDLVSRTGAALRERLGIEKVTSAEYASVQAALPFSRDAAQLYAEGVKKLRVFDALGGRELLQKAVAVEPNYPMSHLALSEAWSRLGYQERAKSEAQKAFDLSANLSREQRLYVEAQYRELNHEWDKAIRLYRSLSDLFPDNVEYALRMADAQRQDGNGKDALVTLARLRGVSAEDPRLDLAEAVAQQSLGDFRGEKESAARAAEKATSIGAPLLLAEAQLDGCWASRNLGQYEDAKESCEAARQIFGKIGDHFGTARSLSHLGTVYYESGQLPVALRTYENALKVFQQVGEKRRTAVTLNTIANVLADSGHHLTALKYYQQSLLIAQEVDSKSDQAVALGNIAIELRLAGDLSGSTKNFREAAALDRKIGSRDSEARHLDGLGNVLFLQGKLEESERALNQSVEICRAINLKKTCAYALTYSGDVLRSRGKLDESRAKYEEALTLWKDIGNPIQTAVTRLLIAGVCLDQGDAKQAEVLARGARQEFRKEKIAELEIWADASIADALLAQGKPAEAREELNSSRHAQTPQIREVRLELAVTTASVLASSSSPRDRTAAVRSLEATLAEAKKYGYVPHQLDARLALGEIEMKSGQIATGRTTLAALQIDAAAQGFTLVAQKALKAQALAVAQ